MGIYDRDYYRETPNSWWPSFTGHQGVWLIVAVTSLIYILQLAGLSGAGPRDAFPESIGRWGHFNLPDVLNGQVWRLITASFVHSPYSLIPVVLGMIALYMFGTALESIYGSSEFLAFYLVIGLCITLTLTVTGLLGLPTQTVYFGSQAILTAVIVLFACHFPEDRVYILFIPVPAWLLAGLWVGLNLLGFLGGSLSVIPHLLAALLAYTYQRIDFRILGFLPRFSWPANRTRQSNLKVYSPSIGAPSQYDEREFDETPPVGDSARVAVETRPASPPLDEQLEAKVDQILAKVASQGRNSLTAEENAVLQRASEEYQRRRNRKA
jgi:membrane associated rhomboid family serine protease